MLFFGFRLAHRFNEPNEEKVHKSAWKSVSKVFLVQNLGFTRYFTRIKRWDYFIYMRSPKRFFQIPCSAGFSVKNWPALGSTETQCKIPTWKIKNNAKFSACLNQKKLAPGCNMIPMRRLCRRIERNVCVQDIFLFQDNGPFFSDYQTHSNKILTLVGNTLISAFAWAGWMLIFIQ